jgi:branched-chain amino acid transport system ATP-binding protein
VAPAQALPPHMSYVLIEHDLDIALRVVERVTVMHNGACCAKARPSEIETIAQVQAIYMGGKH